MKKLFILFLFFYFLLSNYSLADCITGYACSIESLQSNDNNIEKIFIKELNKYFEHNINEEFMLGNVTKNVEYKDLFPFSAIYLP